MLRCLLPKYVFPLLESAVTPYHCSQVPGQYVLYHTDMLPLKNEIETQVQDMLDNGLIQSSNSPLSSPVLLVKKKDQSYKFCIDYRYLNAITAKGQLLIPVIDNFLNKLHSEFVFKVPPDPYES
jgi:tRNA A37 N6-isopentenylltransferase MiaA